MYLIYRWVIRVIYALLRFLPTKNRVAFLSRQSNRPSLDFELLESALRDQLVGWEFKAECYRDTNSQLIRVAGTLRQLILVATSKLCVVDGYTPAVSVPNLDSSTVVVQLWHALGALKRFGWQAVGSADGRTEKQAARLCMHRNYSAIIAGGEGARDAYAQAFGYPPEKIIPLGMPRADYLMECDKGDEASERKHASAAIVKRYPQVAGERVNVLFVPTFRREIGSANVERYAQDLAAHLPAKTSNLIVAFHPFSEHNGEAAAKADSETRAPIIHIPHTKGIDLLGIADYVITDYSAIAFEAALLRRKVLFFVPDIEDYRVSPGLNVDPEQQFPAISFKDAAALTRYMHDDRQEGQYAASGFWQYCDSYLTQPTLGATQRIAAYLAELVA
ncbi:MAG: CDP-glycerol glycerophosphotransferase family protein [Coriobacteriales bacterium]|nr:CDP-glycerol glycerophosphotransferase family protein [Coriobacteriales bacterium]